MKKFLMIFVLLLSGCLGGYSPNSKFYDLQPLSDTDRVESRKMVIVVDEAIIPEYLSKPQIVSFVKGKPQMKIDEFNRWGEPLTTMIQRVLAVDLSYALPKAEVLPHVMSSQDYEYVLLVQITRFDMLRNGEAVLEAWWFVFDAAGKQLRRERSLLELKFDNGYDGYVDAQSKLLAALSFDIAKVMAEI